MGVNTAHFAFSIMTPTIRTQSYCVGDVVTIILFIIEIKKGDDGI